MQNTPAAYKAELKKTGRRPTYVQVYIGVINDTAQRSPTIVSEDLFQKASINLNNPMGELVNVATWERQRLTVDGSQVATALDTRLINYGFISKALSDAEGNFATADKPYFSIDFGIAQDLYGITFVFDSFLQTVATDITVQGYLAGTNTETKNIKNPEQLSYLTATLGFNKVDKIVVTINQINKPYQHFRISQTTMGMGLTFNNSDIFETSLSIDTDPLSGTIPSYSFKLTLNNVFNQFNFEDPDNFIWFVQNKQKMQVSYGQEVEDGDIVWLKGGTYIVNKPPVVNETTAEISAGSVFDYLDYLLDGTQLPSTTQDLYSLTEYVMDLLNKFYIIESLKISYILDSGMKNIFTSAPLPAVELRQALQYIANAAMCSIYVDRDFNIIFKSAYIPEASLSYTLGEKYSSSDGILEGAVPSSNYARWSNHFIKVNGMDYFDPYDVPSDEYHQVGYCSTVISDASGEFFNKPTLTVTYTAATNVSNFTIVSDVVIIKEMTIVGYRDNLEVFNATVSATDFTYVYPDLIIGVDKLVITVNRINQEHSPIIIKEINCVERTNYLLARTETTGEPETTILNPLRAVNVAVYKYTVQDAVEELGKTTAYCAPQTNTQIRIDFSEPVSVTDVSVSQGRVVETTNTAYASIVTVSNFGDEGFETTVTVQGKKVIVTKETYIHKIQDNGYVETVDNPLVTSIEHAKRIANWIADYAAYPKQYTVPYRGDPSLDAIDFIRYETKIHTTPLTLITGYELNVGQGMTGSLTLKEVKED